MDFSLPDSDVWDDSPQDKFLENYCGKYKFPAPNITKKKSKRKKQKLSNLNEDDHVLQPTETQISHIAPNTKTKNEKITSGSNHLNTKKQKNDTLKNYLDSSGEILSSKAENSNLHEKRKFKNKWKNRIELLHSEPASSLQGDKLSSKKKMKLTSETAEFNAVRDVNLVNSKHDKNNVEPQKVTKCNKSILRSNKLKKSSLASKTKGITVAVEFPSEDRELIEEIKNSSIYKQLQSFTGQQQFFKQIDSSNNISEFFNDEEHIPDVGENEVQVSSVKQTSQSIIERETMNNKFGGKKKIKSQFKNKTESFHTEPATTLHGDKLPLNRKKKKKKQILKTGVDGVMGDMGLTNLKHGKNNVQLEKISKHNKKTLCTNDIKKISPGSKASNVTQALKLPNEHIEVTKEVKGSCKMVQNFSRKLQFPRQSNSSCNFSNSSNEGFLDRSENKVTFLKRCSNQSAMEYKSVPETSLHKNRKSKSSSFITKAKEMLSAAKFRYLNEKLYTESGIDAYEYFQNNADEFEDYHAGYKMQIQKWPMNPVNLIIEDLQKLSENAVIADMGCGDAKIAQTFTDKTVYSFDLIALNEFVTPCDISKVPLPNESVDIVVFCLSLMGTNFKDYLFEGHRILKESGVLKIAEVESRVDDLDQFIKCLKCMGFLLERRITEHKMFVFLDFKKVKRKMKKGIVPNISLNPCLYKKR